MRTRPKPIKTSPHIDAMLKELRAHKLPFWRRLLAEYRRWKRARDNRRAAKHIATFIIWRLWVQTNTSTGAEISHDTIPTFVNLYQRGHKRWYAVKHRARPFDIETSRVFQLDIKPWLDGTKSNRQICREADRTKDTPSRDSFAP